MAERNVTSSGETLEVKRSTNSKFSTSTGVTVEKKSVQNSRYTTSVGVMVEVVNLPKIGRVTQAPVEILLDVVEPLVITQYPVEILVNEQVPLISTQYAIEVILLPISQDFTVTLSSAEGISDSNDYLQVEVIEPVDDITNEGWTNELGGSTDLYLSIDEKGTVNDSDYIQSPENPVNATYETLLASSGDPEIHTNHFVVYRYAKTDVPDRLDLVVTLLCGSTSIASWTHMNISNTLTTVEQTLTEEQAGNITDYSDLRIRFVATKV